MQRSLSIRIQTAVLVRVSLLVTDLLPAVLQLLQVRGIPLRALKTSQVQLISKYTSIHSPHENN